MGADHAVRCLRGFIRTHAAERDDTGPPPRTAATASKQRRYVDPSPRRAAGQDSAVRPLACSEPAETPRDGASLVCSAAWAEMPSSSRLGGAGNGQAGSASFIERTRNQISSGHVAGSRHRRSNRLSSRTRSSTQPPSTASGSLLSVQNGMWSRRCDCPAR